MSSFWENKQGNSVVVNFMGCFIDQLILIIAGKVLQIQCSWLLNVQSLHWLSNFLESSL